MKNKNSRLSKIIRSLALAAIVAVTVTVAAAISGAVNLAPLTKNNPAPSPQTIWNTTQNILSLQVRQIRISGNHHLSTPEIHNTLAVTPGDHILRHNLNHLQDRLHTLPWIAGASVQRELPDTLNIRLREKQPCARHQHNKKISVIDTDGHIIPNIAHENFAHLPLLVGANAQHGCQLWNHWTKLLNDTPLAAARVSNRRWNLYLRSNVVLMLPEQNPDAALARLRTLQNKHQLLSTLKHHAAGQNHSLLVDLRVKNRIRLRGFKSDDINDDNDSSAGAVAAAPAAPAPDTAAVSDAVNNDASNAVSHTLTPDTQAQN